MNQPQHELRLGHGTLTVWTPQGSIEISSARDYQGRQFTQVNILCPEGYAVNPDPTRATGEQLRVFLRERVVHIMPVEDEHALDRHPA